MRNNEDNLFMSRKKNPSFTEWTLQNGIVNPQSKKPAATNVGGGVHDDPHSQTNQWVTSRTTTSTQTQTDPFLEGFYSVADKPETERKTYLQHREKTETEKPAIQPVGSETTEDNNARKQYGQMLDYIEDSDYKYLADFDKSREKYIEDLQKEVEKLEETKQLGYLPLGENEIFKEEAINTLKRIIYLNQQYDRFSKIRDKELSDAARLN